MKTKQNNTQMSDADMVEKLAALLKELNTIYESADRRIDEIFKKLQKLFSPKEFNSVICLNCQKRSYCSLRISPLKQGNGKAQLIVVIHIDYSGNTVIKFKKRSYIFGDPASRQITTEGCFSEKALMDRKSDILQFLLTGKFPRGSVEYSDN